VVSGVFTLVASASVSITVGTSKILALQVSGTGATVSLAGYADGVNVLNYSDTDAARIVATGRAGLRLYTETSGDIVDDFVASYTSNALLLRRRRMAA
jgi:hypothetical protein